MAVLKNAKHDAFARAIVAGTPARHAYRGAGYNPKSDDVADACASRLLADAKVAERVTELKEAAAEQAVMSRAEVLAELSHLGRANLADFVVGGYTTADVVESLQALPREHAAAIQELTIETYVEGGGESAQTVKRVKLKLHDKRAALGELRRHHEPIRHEHTGKGGGPIETKDVGDFSDLEVMRRIAFMLARATVAGGALKPPQRAVPAPPPPSQAKTEPADE